MRKISKLSLVAAVAVAGFSTANAQPLEEAIKNVEVSGSVVYRYDNFDDDKGTFGNEHHSEKNKYKIGLNLTSKVNDYVKFNSRFLVANGANNGEFAELDAHKGSDTNPDVTLSHANFAFTGIQNTTVIAGKQGLATPYTVAIDSDGNEETGTGVLALSSVGPVTAGAGYFNQTNLDKSGNINGTKFANNSIYNVTKVDEISTTAFTSGENLGSRDIYVATLQADLSPVKLESWYLDIADTLDSYTLVAKADFKPSTDSKIGVEARYVSLTLDNGKKAGLDSNDNEMYRLAVTGNLGIFNAKVGYTGTSNKGGLTAFDQDAENATLGWNLSSNGIADADYWQGVLGVNILDNLNLSANYGNLKADRPSGKNNGNYKDLEIEEVFGQLTYKMSKNLSTYLRYGTYEEKYKDNGAKETYSDQNRGRIQVEYTF
ncbi:major outer membrane protein [Aliarcobacter butzleri]|uniref:major outer membrane protein n=1 Tax=Aliarcobacter butzleri TaxID=28197 RepID=UPI00214BB8E7|nr:major outer membrane protein [Aliarcobacter butzleri]MCP3649894.1 major outer membrane protein [Arcobacter sp. DNRA7]MCR1816067.1 major outer membrane protein [Aliarcobacter butzleri]